MDLKLNNKVAIVLAASKGLGKAIAQTLSAEGASVIIGSRDRAELDKAATEISALTGNPVVAIAVDVSVADEVESFIQQAAAAFGRIDILLNNAG
jgi:3-oxoacyl-[acyl-carrier protein] reductase